MSVRLVIDVLGGTAVRGVAGRRDEYRPVESVLTPSTDPRDVAEAFRQRLGVTSLYVADLDGVLHDRADLELLRSLAADEYDVLADTGVRNAESAERLADTGVQGVVAALETLPSPDALRDVVEAIGVDRLVFSLDLKDGRPLSAENDWPAEPLDIVETVVSIGVRRIIVLDLVSVGVGRGVSTLSLCRAIRARFPHVRLVTGGGVRSDDDVGRVLAAGVDECLVASAAHDGSLALSR